LRVLIAYVVFVVLGAMSRYLASLPRTPAFVRVALSAIAVGLAGAEIAMPGLSPILYGLARGYAIGYFANRVPVSRLYGLLRTVDANPNDRDQETK